MKIFEKYMTYNTKDALLLQNYVASLVNPIYTNLGFEDEGSHLQR